ncbi:MAG: saccharopine dehydrogenase NADP-binding domain-containing protein [Candidatus Cloacimonetes bacterium]|nr:saccharopine dehydrogenase NADP-binding domain-containing protein [Candidatus Cloacimonadota bacterium]MCF7813413.1 saccharopine dehydrogenase NADP-binding domain-containing protein [Candidatus Cloacimonadota bacterium]MCF7867706.1 saccharopine dehydrogenase NADP-binding domain-containing protein [Candidatus Cloacimonadota bacterium]MCF7883208.1 saccharopine dehydrogenase NADP-binding domain-containing protein [Candidatus Cloacimonadota bacterium]
MAKITVLGCGMVGSAIALDLAKKHKVLSVDVSKENLKSVAGRNNISIEKLDLSKAENILKAITKADLVVNAVPGFMGFQTTKTVIESGKNIVDISFFPEDCFELDEQAKSKNLIAIVDCGVAPGMGNVILGHHNAMMQVESYECYVGGLPQKRTLPFQYKAPFSPIDVIEEYTRPARYIRDGKLVTKPALSEPEFMEFAEIGTLEAFNTDGLRSLLFTMKIPNMIEKTMRFPGHIDYMKMLRESGFFAEDEIEVKGRKIKPIELTAKLLFKQWKLEKDEPEFTVMKIIIAGKEQEKRVCYQYDLLDRYDEETGISSMARTTGYSATAAVDLILNGDFKKVGINPPEFVGAETGCLEKMLKYQEERGIKYKVSRTEAGLDPIESLG